MAASGIDFNVAGVCPAILTTLESVAGMNNPELKQTPVGTLVALSQPENQSAELLSVYGGNKTGHALQARIKYLPRETKDTVKTTADCVAGESRQYLETESTLDIYRQKDIYLTMDEVRVFCKEASNYKAGLDIPAPMMEIYKRLASAMNAMRTSLNDAVVTKIEGAFGINSRTGSDSSVSIPVISAGATGIVAGAPIYSGLQTILTDFTDNELNGTPIIIGKGNFEKFDIATNRYGLQNSGINFANINQDYKFFVDKAVDTIVGANQLIVMGEGSAQFLSWNKFVGNFKTTIGSNAMFTIPDLLVPRLLWDVDFDWDACEKAFLLRLSINAGTFVTPTDAYSTYDDLAGTNGLLRYTATVA
jgi:hypothetical protein